MLTAALTSAILAAIFVVVGGLIEDATGEVGIGGYFLLDWLWTSGPLMAGLFFFMLTMTVVQPGLLGGHDLQARWARCASRRSSWRSHWCCSARSG